MKRVLFAAVALVTASSAHAADVGVSVAVGDSGFYGRIDIGNAPPPQVIYTRPVVIQPVAVEVERPPIYLRVPPGHAKNWKKHCKKYDACGERVFFVQDRWYQEVYVPQYHAQREQGNEDHGHGNGNGNGNGHGHGKGKKND